ncbi:MAG: hypothetical protein ABI615_03225 [Chthoniobacterales bacterium]
MKTKNFLVRGQASGRAAFTILELLAACAVFALMLTFTLQIVSHSVKLIDQTTRQMQGANSTRRGLDALSQDIRGMLRSQGLTMVVGTDSTGSHPENVKLAFLCKGRGSSAAFTILRYSEVCYKVAINSTPNPSGLLRLKKDIYWDSGNPEDILNTMVALREAAGLTSTDITSELVSDKIVRMAIAFIWNRNIPNSTDTISSEIPNEFDLSYIHSDLGLLPNTVDVTKLSAIVVAFVAVDKKTQEFLNSTGKDYSLISAKFNVPILSGQMPMTVWSGVDLSSLPDPVKSGVRLFQKVIPIN